MDKPKIKIVKRTEAVAAKSNKSKKRKIATPRSAAREMVSTVTEWVTDLKQRKSEETKAAIDMLFTVHQRPSES